MLTVAYSFASFLSFFPASFRAIILGAVAVLAVWGVMKLVAAVLDAIPFL